MNDSILTTTIRYVRNDNIVCTAGIIPVEEFSLLNPINSCEPLSEELKLFIGKEVCVVKIDTDLYSRKKAQERFLSQIKQWQVLSSTIKAINSAGVFIDIGCGIISCIDLPLARANAMGLRIGNPLNVTYSHIENSKVVVFPDVVSYDYKPGDIVLAVVRDYITDYSGCYARIEDGICGILPTMGIIDFHKLRISPGDKVICQVKRIGINGLHLKAIYVNP